MPANNAKQIEVGGDPVEGCHKCFFASRVNKRQPPARCMVYTEKGSIGDYVLSETSPDWCPLIKHDVVISINVYPKGTVKPPQGEVSGG